MNMNVEPAFETIPANIEEVVTEPEFDIEYFDYECASPFGCTPNGCPGHESDIPVAIYLFGVRFVVDGFPQGDFPSDDKFTNAAVLNAVQRIDQLTQT
jgi:hypothetical protein